LAELAQSYDEQNQEYVHVFW